MGLTEIKSVRHESAANDLLGSGWALLDITGNPPVYHMAHYRQEPDTASDQRELMVQFLDNIDPETLEKEALSGAGFEDNATVAILRQLKEYVRGS